MKVDRMYIVTRVSHVDAVSLAFLHVEGGGHDFPRHRVSGQGHDLAVGDDDAVSLVSLQRYFPDPLLVVQELALVLSEEDLCQLWEGCITARVDQRPDEKRLIDVAHAHLAFEEVNKLFIFHGAVEIW